MGGVSLRKINSVRRDVRGARAGLYQTGKPLNASISYCREPLVGLFSELTRKKNAVERFPGEPGASDFPNEQRRLPSDV
jgi:hypothetical protein